MAALAWMSSMFPQMIQSMESTRMPSNMRRPLEHSFLDDVISSHDRLKEKHRKALKNESLERKWSRSSSHPQSWVLKWTIPPSPSKSPFTDAAVCASSCCFSYSCFGTARYLRLNSLGCSLASRSHTVAASTSKMRHMITKRIADALPVISFANG
jgi:hypothetical protein